MDFNKEKEEIRNSMSYTVTLISKLIKDERLLERDKMYLRNIKREIQDVSMRIREKGLPIFNEFRRNRLNKNLSTNDLTLLKSK